MLDSATSKPIFALGNAAFTVSGADTAFEQDLARILPRVRTVPDRIHDLSMTGRDVRGLLSEVLALHQNCRWIHAACVVSPTGRKVLIAGPPGAGKTTTALALALRHQWTVLADDVTLIDRQTNVIAGFAAPFSLKPGASELLMDSIGVSPDAPVFGEWLPMDGHYASVECTADFDVWLYFNAVEESAGFGASACTPAEYTRLLLAYSSALHDAGGPAAFAASIGPRTCYRVDGGTVSERVNLVLQLMAEGT